MSLSPAASPPPPLRPSSFAPEPMTWRARLCAAVVTVVWAAFFGHLIFTQVLPERRREAAAQASSSPSTLLSGQPWRDREEYGRLLLGRKPVGAAYMGVVRQAARGGFTEGYLADMRLQMSINLLGFPRQISLKCLCRLDERFTVTSFFVNGDLGMFNVKATGRVQNEELLLRVGDREASQLFRYSVPGEISMLAAVQPAALEKLKLQPGERISVPVVDPLFSMQNGTAEVRVLGSDVIEVGPGAAVLAGAKPGGARDGFTPVNAIKVQTEFNDLKTSTWVTSTGVVLKRQLIGALSMEAATSTETMQLAPELRLRLGIPPLDPKAFAHLPLKPLSSLLSEKESPLAVLQPIAR